MHLKAAKFIIAMRIPFVIRTRQAGGKECFRTDPPLIIEVESLLDGWKVPGGELIRKVVNNNKAYPQ